MKAIVYKRFGEPDVLECVERPMPVPGDGEILIRVGAAGLNPIDYKTRKGLGFAAEKIKDKLPWTPGYDVAGVVESVGPSVSGLAVGDHVAGLVGLPDRGGCYAEYVVAKAGEIVPFNAGLGAIAMGGLPLAALTAWQGLFEIGSLQSGQEILIHAASGGVGHFAVQFAKAKGAYVIATGSGKNETLVRKLGADEFIDYRERDFTKCVEDADVVFDAVGGETGAKSAHVVKKGGVIVTLPTITAEQVAREATALGVVAKNFVVRPDRTMLAEIVALVDSGKVRIQIDSVFPLIEAADAHRKLETGRAVGKIVLKV